jgi:hypothetical protein
VHDTVYAITNRKGTRLDGPTDEGVKRKRVLGSNMVPLASGWTEAPARHRGLHEQEFAVVLGS